MTAQSLYTYLPRFPLLRQVGENIGLIEVLLCVKHATDPERRGRWEVKRPSHWDELPWAERP